MLPLVPAALAICLPAPQVEVMTDAAWDAGGSCYVRALVRRLDRDIKGPLLVTAEVDDGSEMCVGYDEQVAWLSRRAFDVTFEFPGVECRDLQYLDYYATCRS